MTRARLAGAAVAALLAAGGAQYLPHAAASGQSPTPAAGVPRFEVDPTWPTLPNDWVLGTSINVSVDSRDHVWIVHRFRFVPEEDRERAAPPVLEFDENGRFVQGWGGPSDAYEWPDLEHGITVDYQDHVWISGSNPIPASGSPRSDDMLLRFTRDGTLVRQIGRRDQSGGNQDTINLQRPCEVFVYSGTNEAVVADGYGNRRIIVLDPDTGAFKRMWGAFGNGDPPRGPATRHRVRQRVYVADRNNQRIQVFTLEGQYLEQAFVNRNESADPAPAGGRTVSGIAFSADEAQRFIYVADYSNSHGRRASVERRHPQSRRRRPRVRRPRRPTRSRNNQRIQVFTLEGQYLEQAFVNRNESADPAPAGGRTVSGIAFSADEAQRFIYVADYSNSHVTIVERDTLEAVDSFGTRSPRPGDFAGIHNLAVDSKGNLYTAESDPNNRAQKFVLQ